MTKKTLRKLELLLLVLTPSFLLLKAYDEITRRLFFPAFIISGLCLLLLCVLIFWKPLHIAPKQARTLCYYIATPALLTASYMSYLENNGVVTFVLFFAGLLYPLAGFAFTKQQKK